MHNNKLNLILAGFFLSGCSSFNQVPINSTISKIQGSGEYSTVAGIDVANEEFVSKDFYQVKGVITAIQTKNLGRDLPVGFFMQGKSDNNPNTSDGIFVETDDIGDLRLGEEVQLTAKVKEDYGFTKLVDVRDLKVLRSDVPLPKPVVLTVGRDFEKSLEKVEGMRVILNKSSQMYVTSNYGFDYGAKRNNLVLANKGALVHPNQNYAPRSQKSKHEPVLIVESFAKAMNGEIPWYLDFGKPNGKGSTSDYIRVNDQVNGLEGIVGYSYGNFRLYVTNQANKSTFIHTVPRHDAPPLKKGGNLRIASFNVLNYFNSPYGGDSNALGQNRGASSQEEFKLQGEKIANAIVKLNADIVGLMEIENNGFGDNSAVSHLVKLINSKIKDPSKHYVHLPANGNKFIGSDAITTQIIYRKHKVNLKDYSIIQMPEQHAPKVSYSNRNRNSYYSGNSYQRNSILAKFSVNGKPLIVTVNHFKSKGSVCWDDVKTGKLVDLDKQGSCENLRVAAAERLGEALSKYSGAKIILGDLNSYANEDPLMVLTNRLNAPANHEIKAGAYTFIDKDKLYGAEGEVVYKSFGYINIIKKLHPRSYSYSYGNHVGSLDYILISPNLERAVVDANDWDINAGESTLFEYANKFNCSGERCSYRYKDVYRASDHNPAVMDLNTHKMPN